MKKRILMILGLILLICIAAILVKLKFFSSKNNTDETYYVIEDEDTGYDGEDTTNEYLPVEADSSDESDEIENKDKNEAIGKPNGKYSASFSDEIDGEEIFYEVSYTFNSDGTGVYDGQDTIDFTWKDDYIMMNDYKYEFVLNDNCLSVYEYSGIQEYYQDK